MVIELFIKKYSLLLLALHTLLKCPMNMTIIKFYPHIHFNGSMPCIKNMHPYNGMKHGHWWLFGGPLGRKLMKCKWVYWVKTKPNGSIGQFKAWLVANSYCQTYGISNALIKLALMLKYDTICTILFVVVAKYIDLFQFDITMAFLHESIDEKIYVWAHWFHST